MTPTQRTLQRLRKDGWTCQVVEYWNSFAKIRKDLFGVIDVVGVHPDRGIIGIQATSGDNLSKRVKKSQAEPRLKTWIEAGGKFQAWGWRKSARTRRYELRKVELKCEGSELISLSVE